MGRFIGRELFLDKIFREKLNVLLKDLNLYTNEKDSVNRRLNALDLHIKETKEHIEYITRELEILNDFFTKGSEKGIT